MLWIAFTALSCGSYEYTWYDCTNRYCIGIIISGGLIAAPNSLTFYTTWNSAAISKPFIPKHSILVICRNDIGYSETRLG